MLNTTSRRALAVLAALALIQFPHGAAARSRPAKPVAEKPVSKAERQKPADRTAQADKENVRPVKRGGPLYAVVIGPGPTWRKGQPLRKSRGDDHWKYWQGLRDKGLVESAGLVGQDTGLVLLHARNQREANAMLSADPAIRTGRFRGVARPFDQTIGE